MNGQVSEMCKLTAQARFALKGGAMRYTAVNFVHSEKFVFLPRKTKIIEHSAEKWFAQLKHLGVEDIFMLLPQTAKNREIYGYSNSNGGCILCLFESGEVTYFSPEWFSDSKNCCWHVIYTEYKWDNPPEGKPRFSDNTEEFKSALLGIAEFAEKIDQSFWSGIFRKALGMLDGSLECENADLPDLPERNLRLYCAVRKADVFGAMGSWNDTPPIYAAERGLSEEYKRFSNELFIQIQKALVFAINMF